MNFGRYNEVYGALGGVVVLMLWLYLNGMVLLMGGKINSVVYRAQLAAEAVENKPAVGIES